MSEVTTTAPEPATAVDRVRALLPEIAARAEEIEQARAVPRDLTEKLRAAGVYRRYVPRSHHGEEVWPDDGLVVIEELARADASVAWVAAVGSEGPSFYAYLPADTYDQIFSAGPDVIHTGVINPTGRAVRDGDGYRFSGRWSFASGCANADYICLNGMLEEGTIDVLISPRVPSSYRQGHPDVVRLFPNYKEEEKRYYARTGFVPIMHTVVIRKSLYESQPWIAQSLFKAFRESGKRCEEMMLDVNALPYCLPWYLPALEETIETFGRDFWPEGVAENWKNVEALMTFAKEQGLIDRLFKPEELFAPNTLKEFRI